MRQFKIVPALVAMLLAGCVSPTGAGAHAGEKYVVNSAHCPFYSYGPAQATGPDFTLSRGQQVTMLSYQYGFCQVTILATGQAGYVPTEQISPAPPAPRPSPSASPAGHRRRHAGDQSAPPTAADQSRIPLPEFPESKPPPTAPPFRY